LLAILAARIPPLATHSTDFPALVRLLREAKGLTQEEFARELDVTVGTLSGWENGHHRPVKAQRKRLLRLASKARIQPPLARSSPSSGKQQ
jgi:DNA-binding transcriptional regulator YiaG